MPKVKIESEVRPYLNVLIENGASFVWLQDFYQEKIKHEIAKAINSLPVKTLYDRIKLLQLFINNQSINHPTAYQKLYPLRLLFRHSDDLLYDLQKKLSTEILISPNQPFNSFLAQDAEKTLNSLLSLQVLLEIRMRLEKAKIKFENNPLSQHHKIIEKEMTWLKKEIHSRVPSSQRNIKNHEPLKLSHLDKWNIPKRSFGYDTGPNTVWYFFHGETRLILYIQREFLNLISIAFTFKNWVNKIANEKKSIEKMSLSFFRVNISFILQLLSLAFSPYRLLRSLMAEVNHMVYHFMRLLYEYCWPLEHTNKPFLHFVSFSFQIFLYTALLLNLNLSYHWIAPLLVINSPQAVFMASLFLVVFNSAALIMGVAKKFEKNKYDKTSSNTLDLSQELKKTEVAQSSKMSLLVKNKQGYLPWLMKIKVDSSHDVKHQIKNLNDIESEVKNRSTQILSKTLSKRMNFI